MLELNYKNKEGIPMVKVIMGKKGSGKTKMMIDLVNGAAKDSPGCVVCIEKGGKLTYDVSHDARLIDISEYPVKGYNSLLGFICGMYSQNYDMNHIFIDSLFKVADDFDLEKAEKFIEKLNEFTKTNGIEAVITISDDIEKATETLKKYF
jgi:archaellum biogenesis ATPase FlaH